MIRRLEDKVFGGKASDVIAWAMFVGGVLAWPVTAVTVFKDEPQGILGLSYIAIIYTGYQTLQLNHAARKMDETSE